MNQWKDRLSNYESEIGEGLRFRNGLRAVPASSIGEQLYCEMKIEQEYVNGEIETETKNEGTALHEKLLAMKESTIEEIIEGIETQKIFVASFPLAADFQGLKLVGVPDAVVFEKKVPKYILELKTTAKGDTTRIFDGQKAQALIYGLLLESIGFDCSNLNLVIVRYRSTSLSQKEKSKFLERIVASLLNKSYLNLAIKSGYQIVPHTLAYSKSNAIQVLDQTRGYWLSEREPIPTTNPNKCRACEFQKLCPCSLVKVR